MSPVSVNGAMAPEKPDSDDFLVGPGKFASGTRTKPVNYGSPLKQNVGEADDKEEAAIRDVENEEEARELVQSIFQEGEWDISRIKGIEDKLLQILQGQMEGQDEDLADLVREGLKEERKFMDQVKAKETRMRQQIENLKRQQGKKIQEVYFKETEMHDKLKQQIEERTAEHEKVIESLFERETDMSKMLKEKEAQYKLSLQRVQLSHQNHLKKIQYDTMMTLQENREIHEKEIAAMKMKLKQVNETWAKKLETVIDKYEAQISALKEESSNQAEEFNIHMKTLMDEVQKKHVEKNKYFDKAFKEMDERHGKDIERIYEIKQKTLDRQQAMHEKELKEIVENHHKSLENLRQTLNMQKKSAVEAKRELEIKEKEGQLLTKQQREQEAKHQAVIDALEAKENQILLMHQEADEQAEQAMREKTLQKQELKEANEQIDQHLNDRLIQEEEIQRLVNENTNNQREMQESLEQFKNLYQQLDQVQAQSVPENVDAGYAELSVFEPKSNDPGSENWKLIVGATIGGFIALVLLLLGLYKLRQCCKSRKATTGFVVSSQGTSGDIQCDRNGKLNLPLTPDEILAIEVASEQLDDKKFSTSQYVERVESV